MHHFIIVRDKFHLPLFNFQDYYYLAGSQDNPLPHLWHHKLSCHPQTCSSYYRLLHSYPSRQCIIAYIKGEHFWESSTISAWSRSFPVATMIRRHIFWFPDSISFHTFHRWYMVQSSSSRKKYPRLMHRTHPHRENKSILKIPSDQFICWMHGYGAMRNQQ